MSLRKRIFAAVERLQPVSMALAEMVGRHSIDSSATALVIANGSTVGLRTIAPITAGFATISFIVDSDDRMRQLADATKDGNSIMVGDPLNIDLPKLLSFAAVLAGPAQMRDTFEEFLFERLPAALSPGAIVVAQLCRDTSASLLSTRQVASRDANQKAADFLRSQFRSEVVDEAAIRARFESDSAYDYVGWAPRSGTSAAQDPFVWLVLKSKEAKNRRPVKARALEPGNAVEGFPRTPRADQFLLSDFSTMLAAMRRADIKLLPVDKFAKRLQNLKERSKARSPRPFGMIKFDIHGNIRRPLEMARALSRADSHGLFLMMPRHPLNEAFYDQSSTWRLLKRIERLGHEIEIHLDVFHLIAQYGDLYTGLDAALSDFRARKIDVRCATLHGDTRSHIKAVGLQVNDFFSDGLRKTKWNGKLPEGEPHLKDHIGHYSHAKLARDFGIAFTPEVNFLCEGRPISKHQMVQYLSDNQRTFAIRGGSERDSRVVSPEPYRLTRDFLKAAMEKLSERPFLALLHPQWYW